MRKIIHVDMDAFFASVEQRDRPELRGKPVVVGGEPNRRSVVASASYEARKYGIRSAMSCAKAYRLCPHTVFIYPNIEKYCEASRKIREIFNSFTSLVEPLSLDEAYLDVTTNHFNEPIAKNIAISIKARIRETLGLTASAGVGPNKFIAKLASDLQKPNGLVVVPPEKVADLIKDLPVEKFWGVGPATTKKLHSYGIRTADDVRKAGLAQLEKAMGSYGHFIYGLAHGKDDRPVDPSEEAKSRGSETTFDTDILDANVLIKHIESFSREVSEDLREMGVMGRTVTLKIKYFDFKQITRSRTFQLPTDSAEWISRVAKELLFSDTEVGTRPVRLLGVSVGSLTSDEDSLQLWFNFDTHFSG